MDALDAFRGAFSDQLVTMAEKKRIPLSGTVELLPICNMRCRMCYIQHKPKNEELQPVSFWLDLYKQMIDEGLLFSVITGGEPFLYPGFKELYEKLARLPVHICINTNATLLDREKVKWLADQPPRRVNVSLYGTSNETYARLCGNPNGFTQVMNALDLFQEYSIPFRVHSTLVPENIGDYQGIIDICNQRKAHLQMVYYMFPAYRKECGVATTNMRFEPKEMAKIAMKYTRDQFLGKATAYIQYIAFHCAFMEHPNEYPLYGKNNVHCRAGSCSYWVNWRGEVSSCGMHNQNTIDLHHVAFKEAWKQIVEETDKTRISSKCKHCEYRCICPVCSAACFCETGSMDGTPEYLCSFCKEYAKLLFKERALLLEKE